MSIERAQYYGKAADEVEEIIREVYGVDVCKAARLATTEGMELEARRVGRRLLDVVMPLESKIITQTKERLALYSPTQSAASLTVLATQVIAQAKRSLPLVQEILRKETPSIMVSATTDLAAAHKLKNITHDLAPKAYDFLGRVDSMFITAAYDKKAMDLAGRWKEIASKVNKGILDTVRTTLSATLDHGLGWGSSESYWTTIATAFVNRIKSWSATLLFDSNKVRSYKWVSVMDSATSMQCRFLDGRVFPVAAVMAKLTELLPAQDLKTVRRMQPFLQIGKRNEGKILYYETDGETNIVASISEEEGQPVGFMSDLGDGSELALIDAGVVFPPIHTWCRSTIVPSGDKA